MAQFNLIEIVQPKMDILFVALNPPVGSNHNGHYFSNNLSFWNLLYQSGLITKRVKSKLTGDDEVFRSNSINYKNAVYGIIDLVHDVIETNSNKVKVDDQRISRILEMLDKNEVGVMCLMHSKVAKAFQAAGIIVRSDKYGMVGKYKNTLIYEVPFHNASIGGKERYYELLKNTF